MCEVWKEVSGKNYYVESSLVFAENPTSPKFKNMVGLVFGNLTVIGHAGMAKGVRSWYCKCSCDGSIIKVTGNNLNRGNTKSCGCHQKQTTSKHCKRGLDHYIERLAEVTDDYEIVSKGTNYASSDWVLFCKKCNESFQGRIASALRGSKICPCSGKKKHTQVSMLVDAENYCNEHNYSLNKQAGEYLKTRTYYNVTCKKCKYTFDILYTNLMQGKGCKQCSVNNLVLRISKDFDYYSQKATEVHEGKYSYVLCNKSAKAKDKVEIVCSKHDTSFMQTWDNHISKKKGCPLCGNERKSPISANIANKNKKSWLRIESGVYLIKSSCGVYKIGVAAQLNKRVSEINLDSGLDFEPIVYRSMNKYSAAHVEDFLHKLFSNCSTPSEKIFAGHTELFSLGEGHVKFVEEFLLSDFREDWYLDKEASYG